MGEPQRRTKGERIILGLVAAIVAPVVLYQCAVIAGSLGGGGAANPTNGTVASTSAPPNEVPPTSSSNSTDAAVPQPQQTSGTLAATIGEPGTPINIGWEYTDFTDKMRGTVTHLAAMPNSEFLHLSPPYSGKTLVLLRIEKGPSNGLTVALATTSGQFICRQFAGDFVSVKFDDRAIQRYRCANTADGSSDTMYLLPASKFVSEIKRSKHVTIEVNYFQDGSRQIEYYLRELKW